MRKILLTLLWAILPLLIVAQHNSFVGARANAVGYCASSLGDVWSVFNNPAGISELKQTSVGLTYDLDPAFPSFNRMAFAFVLPISRGASGIGFYRFGDDLFNEQIITCGYANKFGITSIGAKLNYLQYTAEGFGRKNALTFSLGGITNITDWLSIGAQVININQPRISVEERVPSIMTLNATIKASKKVTILLEVEKNIGENAMLKTGMEYQPRKKFFIRTGFQPAPVAAFFGFGFHLRKLEWDYAYTYSLIGARHQIAFQYNLTRKA